MIPGEKINLGGEEYILPPLSLGQLRNGVMAKMKEHDRLVEAEEHHEAMLVRGEIIGEALRRNYPDLTNEHLFDILDMRNWVNSWQIVLGRSGFLAGTGETGAETPTPTLPGISAPSTAGSSEQPDGPSGK